MSKTYRWAIVGLGNIAHSFVTYFNQPDGEIYAVCSRSQAKADQFASEHHIAKAYSQLSDLLADDQVDIVYVATPHNYHIETILPALAAGKHVFCEKAITMTSDQLAEAKALAHTKGLVLAEAMTLYHMPLYQKLHEFAVERHLGDLKMVQASFGSFKEPDPTNRFFNPDLAGGALLDIGVYALAFVREFLTAKPYLTGTTMHRFSSGVDEAETLSLRNANDELANVSLTFRAKMPKQGLVAYEGGYFTVDTYPRADQALFTASDGSTELIKAGDTTNAMNYEIAAMQQMIANHEPNTSLVKTTDVMDIMTAARQQWDFRYPFE
ncbi:Gfo/Idh/MocA family protein [Lactiplantibacillus mudanjiangensis]|uniref:Oxidoreductase (Putative) [Lactobacillus plantarum JDM1] n=1 Tax=Lactiplantibacillus mudanjiangensis TaxID=1296538 RepID=A0A660E1P1_9LACO|nr:Gfo/Idh/MocA family oxidoreductase [Lactiplantibacillus mudanjiangensis]VDG23092.1 oxidoreductase (putative) [Lactobacillus plantarum JDM1] [Lactiplantibacillus mudanjiangensis]VDG29564.1 oxidoreductase (putative) [Lactobacillus plantarum JDM1] [Lactiplantibacillus mudanjiangensis]VDG32677.1 oxidoreductase (putative) [Lactobacillus plantarum JDM1] [Lactiplantibacillus mudanjiangensis]